MTSYSSVPYYGSIASGLVTLNADNFVAKNAVNAATVNCTNQTVQGNSTVTGNITSSGNTVLNNVTATGNLSTSGNTVQPVSITTVTKTINTTVTVVTGTTGIITLYLPASSLVGTILTVLNCDSTNSVIISGSQNAGGGNIATGTGRRYVLTATNNWWGA
jgi:hypothetical protein